MRNVTITMDDEVARWARIEAARREQSLARFIGELLREHMRDAATYEDAMREFLATGPTGGSGGRGLPGRDEVHERASLR
jgi:hypothetical protein